MASSPVEYREVRYPDADLLEQLLTRSLRGYVLDAIWQDGGTIIEQPNGELIAFLTKFKPQTLTTDDNGLPVRLQR